MQTLPAQSAPSAIGVFGCVLQTPALQTSEPLHGLPSLQEVPSGLVGFEQPVAGSHVPATWQTSCAAHVTGFEPTQAPAWHVSVCVHALPSSHAEPSVFVGFEHTPVDVLHVPALWHWSDAEQTTGFEPVHTPAWHVSVWVHALPSLHAVPSPWFDQLLVDVLGAQSWQAFDGLGAPVVENVPPMKHPAEHVVPTHTMPAPQLVPFASVG